MFTDKAFNLTMVVSSVWHLFWISVIGIVVTPSVQPSTVHQEVDFLGPILEKTAFDLMVENAKPQAETLYTRSTLFLDDVYLKPKGPQRKILKEFMPDALPDRFSFSLRDYVRNTKEVPIYFAEDLKGINEKISDRKSPSIEGPAAEREIIFKPELLTIPRSLYGDNEEYIIKLKFFVSDNGLVYDVEPVVSSGFPEIDFKATKFLKKWRFSPLNLAEKNKAIWGIITVRVEAE